VEVRKTIMPLLAVMFVLGPQTGASDSGASGSVQLVKDVRPGPLGSGIADVVQVDGALYFMADDGSHGVELWKSDGTPDGTTLVKDVWPGPEGSQEPWYPYWTESWLTAVGDTLYFSAWSPGSEPSPGPSPSPTPPPRAGGLWTSDGTEGGTALVKDVRAEYLTAVGTSLFFVAFDEAHGNELWRSDGTEAGTHMVRDIRSGDRSSDPWHLVAFGDGLLFTASDGVHGDELWRTDGTEAGTVMVKDINRRRASRIEGFVQVGDVMFFSARDRRHGLELWRTEGTRAGTLMVKDIDPGRDPSYAIPIADVDGRLFFEASVSGRRGDSIVSRSFLWKTDGTEEGTAKIAPISIGPWDPDEYWYLPKPLAAIGPTLFFTSQDAKHGLELWTSDGTRTGTVLVKDIAPGRDDSIPYWFTDVEGTLHFFAFADGPYGRVSLWTSDGTPRGTVMIAGPFRRPQYPDEDLPGPGWITDVNGTIHLVTSGRSTGYELWKIAAPAPSASVTRDRVRPACTITGTSGRDVIRGTDGRDVICARGGNDDVRGRGGDDVLFLGRGRDYLDGGGGDDRIHAGPGWDWGDGGRGDDRVFLQAGPDKIVYGSQGADLLVGGRGDDGCLHVAYDGPGDRVLGGSGRDNFNADPGDVIRSAENGPVDCEGV
jgi:ELWxxDGT repeat protein